MDNVPDSWKKGRYRFKYRGTECLNCGHPLDVSDRFCPNCSQANSIKKLSLKDFIIEFFTSLISYDSKLLNTLGALLLRPGEITRNYINGKRVRYTNPFRFLLSLAIIYFLMVNFTGNFSELDKYGTKKEDDFIENLDGRFGNYTDEGAEITGDIDSLKQEFSLDEFQQKIRKRDSTLLSDPSGYFKKMDTDSSQGTIFEKHDFFRTLLRKDSITGFDDAVTKYGVPETWRNELTFTIANGLLGLQSRPGSFISSLISKLPFTIFFFLPVFALFISLAYIGKKRAYTDHLIFSFYNTALLFILLILSYLIDIVFTTGSNWVFLTIFSVYLFKAMRRFYEEGVFKTIIKYLFLNAIYFILAILAVLILFTGNIFTY
ncbi:DUF3667 domain-containing protein [Pricia sp. S334]|uniref:DUF3667 domain-containing protein n=1 Tax=Pricia mediterranea TaxID=3076079 RepID=A0ABU3L9D3_9FLAO|nr:DUF3667 domain-containing protein [Pricia sp. S334]MDT7829692.1 DUF3667 domain-containing protein [Pricia sp. S334]